MEVKQAILHEEGKMDDGLEFTRSQDEESRTARVIRKCSSLFTKFTKYGAGERNCCRIVSFTCELVRMKKKVVHDSCTAVESTGLFQLIGWIGVVCVVIFSKLVHWCEFAGIRFLIIIY